MRTVSSVVAIRLEDGSLDALQRLEGQMNAIAGPKGVAGRELCQYRVSAHSVVRYGRYGILWMWMDSECEPRGWVPEMARVGTWTCGRSNLVLDAMNTRPRRWCDMA